MIIWGVMVSILRYTGSAYSVLFCLRRFHRFIVFLFIILIPHLGHDSPDDVSTNGLRQPSQNIRACIVI